VSENVEHELPSQGSPAGALEPTPVKSEKSEPTEVLPPAASDLAQDREVEALQTLYRQVIHLPEPEREYQPDEPITRMTHNQLKSMRVKVAHEVEVKVPFKETVANFVIRSFDELKEMFKNNNAPRRLKCLDVGHECIHCGKQFAIEDKKNKDKEKDKKS
jgi:hypothetical protein